MDEWIVDAKGTVNSPVLERYTFVYGKRTAVQKVLHQSLRVPCLLQPRLGSGLGSSIGNILAGPMGEAAPYARSDTRTKKSVGYVSR